MSAFSRLALPLVALVLLVGCLEPEAKPKEDNSIIGKKTQKVGEANEDAAQADLQVKTEDGLAAYPKAYGFAVGEISKMKIKQAVEMYRAMHGEYPKDHETFMEEIIQKGNIELPVLPGRRQYQYDVKKHELIIVEPEKKEPKK